MNNYDGYLPNYTGIKKDIDKVIAGLKQLSESTDTHLADVGCITANYSRILSDISVNSFLAHETLIRELKPQQ